jgi:hypothetical protein
MEASAEQKGVDYQKPHKFDHHQVVCNFYIHISDVQKVLNNQKSMVYK